MWPFDYIPESINPTLRLIIILLISIQFIAFVGYMVVLCKEHKKFKENEKKKEEDESLSQGKTSNEVKEEKEEKDRKNERSSSKTRKKLD